MDVLKVGGQSPVEVRGRHSTPFALRLPPWLPRSDLVEMIMRFHSHLTKELRHMWNKKLDNAGPAAGRARADSGQSDPGRASPEGQFPVRKAKLLKERLGSRRMRV